MAPAHKIQTVFFVCVWKIIFIANTFIHIIIYDLDKLIFGVDSCIVFAAIWEGILFLIGSWVHILFYLGTFTCTLKTLSRIVFILIFLLFILFIVTHRLYLRCEFNSRDNIREILVESSNCGNKIGRAHIVGPVIAILVSNISRVSHSD